MFCKFAQCNLSNIYNMGTYSARVDLNVHQKLPSEKSFIPLKVLEISEYNEYGVLAMQQRLSSRITTLGLLRSSVVMAILLWRSAIVGGRSAWSLAPSPM